MTAFDRAKCAQRNRIAARRDGVDAVPMRFIAGPLVGDDPPALRYAHGTLPADEAAALARINAGLPAGVTPLTLDQVWLHYAEAANGNFVPDRFVFLDDSTLRNIALEAAAGVAFMNSHATGGLSHPAQLPFGRTFAGRYEQYLPQSGAPAVQRALIGFYMIRGTQPNGDAGPSTDDLHTSIAGGTVFDVSVGLGGGTSICDVCGNDLSAPRYVEDEPDEEGYRRMRRNPVACPHVPGTHREMTPEQRAAQQARGVPKGVASYTLVGAHLNELSAVYAGAVPGAGFQKTLAFARQHALSASDLVEARRAYAPLLHKGDLPMDDLNEAIERGVERFARRLGLRPALEPEPLLPGVTGVTELRSTGPDPDTARQLAAEQEQSRLLRTQLAALQEQARIEYVDGLVRSHRLLPAARAGALLDLARDAADDAALPGLIQYGAPDGTLHTGTRVAARKATLEGAPPHALTGETLPASTGLFAVGATPPAGTGDAGAAAEARKVGQTFAAATEPGRNGAGKER